MRRWRAHSTRLQDQDNPCSRSRCRRPGRRRQRRCTLQALWVPHKCHRPNSRRLQGSRPWRCTWCRDQRTCRPPVRNRWRANSSNLRWPECSTPPDCNRSRCTKCPRLATSRLCSGSRRPPGCCNPAAQQAPSAGGHSTLVQGTLSPSKRPPWAAQSFEVSKPHVPLGRQHAPRVWLQDKLVQVARMTQSPEGRHKTLRSAKVDQPPLGGQPKKPQFTPKSQFWLGACRPPTSEVGKAFWVEGGAT